MCLINHNFHHLLADGLDLRSLGVASGSDLSACSFCESNGEHSEEETISCLGLYESLNGGVPLLDDGAELIS